MIKKLVNKSLTTRNLRLRNPLHLLKRPRQKNLQPTSHQASLWTPKRVTLIKRKSPRLRKMIQKRRTRQRKARKVQRIHWKHHQDQSLHQYLQLPMTPGIRVPKRAQLCNSYNLFCDWKIKLRFVLKKLGFIYYYQVTLEENGRQR